MIKLLINVGVCFFLMLGMVSCGENSPGDGEIEEKFVETVEVYGDDITKGTLRQMIANVQPTDADDKTVEWSISDIDIAEISDEGLITAYQNGKIVVTATALDQGVISGQKEITITSFGPPEGSIVVSTPAEFVTAIAGALPGDFILLNGGTYEMSGLVSISHSGTEAEMITVMGNPDDSNRPLLDFSIQSESSSNKGIALKGDYWHFKGIDIYHAGDNGMQVRGSNNIIEFCTFSENADTGLQLDNGASNNLILNCDSYFNADSAIENADGFAAKLSVGSGNKFVGCRAWQNLDDGWDGYLRGADNVTTTYENCWAIKNGYLKNGSFGGGDGNGFKTGGSDDKDRKHNAVYSNCLAVGNRFDGFDHNSNRGEVTLYNCSAYDNGKNFSFGSNNPLAMLTVKNCAILGDLGSVEATAVDITHNSWQDNISVTENDFESIATSQLTSIRKADGSLPDVTFMHLVSDSDLIDAGTDVGLDFSGSAPDLGAFEF